MRDDLMARGAPSSEPVGDQPTDRLVGFLVAQGSIDPASLERARRASQTSGERIDRVLARLGLATEGLVAEAWAAALNAPCMTDDEIARAVPMVDGMRREFLRRRGVLPIQRPDEMLVLLADPLDTEALDAVSFAIGAPVARALGAPSAIFAALERIGEDPGAAAETATASDDLDIQRLLDLASDAPVVHWVNSLIDEAAAARASDIHLEPRDAGCAVRLRIDGILRDADPPAEALAAAVVSRIKILARLDIAERRLPQDGRASQTVRGRRIDLRIATAPTPDGESLTIRLLDADQAHMDLDALGLAVDARRRLDALLAAPNGVILATGPTGSGKTSTLYAAMQALHSGERKLMSVEDPVEYEAPGVTQIQAAPGIGLGFAEALRAMLRHDPDVIMVGEIRDRETAEVAIEAALTGHLVLSTLHTNSAAAAVTRLLEMGTPAYLLSAALSGVVAQRLVRRLCECRTPETADPSLAASLALPPDAELFAAKGCETCRGTGYLGRTVIAEVLVLDDEIRRAVLAGEDEASVQRLAVASGMTTLMQGAVDCALAGRTSLDEALRTTGAT